jgi:DNA adenine methylase
MQAAPVLKYPGGKWRVAEWIISHFPEHAVYLEPYFGSGAIFFNKEPTRVELINDLDQNVVNLFQIIREQPHEFATMISLTPWALDEYHRCQQQLRAPFDWDCATDHARLERARVFVTANAQMFGRKNATARSGWRHRTIASQSPTVTWHKLPERILAAAERLAVAQITREPAAQLIRACNSSDVLIYADPPYLGETRGHSKLYDHEMKGAEEHLDLLNALEAHRGPVVLSGYDSSLYAAHLVHWTRFETQARAQMNQRRTEVIWLNPIAVRRLKRPVSIALFELEASQQVERDLFDGLEVNQ